MKIRLLAILLGLAGVSASDMSVAALVDVRATPRQATLVASGGNMVSIRWTVAASPDHGSGVTSAAAAIVDPSSGAILQRVPTVLNGAGAGPFMLRETLNLDAVTVRGWTDAGLRRVVLQRSFADPATGASVDATVVLNLSASRLQATREASPGELVITSLRLEFETGNNAAVVGSAESLQAVLTVQHTGNGILRGRWQIAEPGRSEGTPMFSTLALVNANVRSGQRSIYLSPALPTGRPGVYVLRFCASEPNDVATSDDVLCPDAEQVVTATYQVQLRDGEPGTGIRGLAPDRAVASGASVFRWQAVPAAKLYQLQIFALAPDVDDSEPADGSAGQPRFVTGMLVRGDAAETRLSELVLSKLQAGQRYLWRITAHDESGRVTATSAEASFVYAPGT
jgi:hypothetical protein